MGSNCSCHSKRDKSKCKKTEISESQLEHRGSNTSNSSVYVCRTNAGRENEPVAVASSDLNPRLVDVCQPQLDGGDTASYSSTMSPTQLHQQLSKNGDENGIVPKDVDLSYMLESVRQMLTGHDWDADGAAPLPHFIRLFLCFHSLSDNATYSKHLVQGLTAVRDHHASLGYEVQVVSLHPGLQLGVWQSSVEHHDPCSSFDIVVLFFGDADAVATVAAAGAALIPRHLPSPNHDGNLSHVLQFYKKDTNDVSVESHYVLEDPRDVADNVVPEVWSLLRATYLTENLYGWDWLEQRILREDSLSQRCICICGSSDGAHRKYQKLLQRVKENRKVTCDLDKCLTEVGQQLLPAISAVVKTLSDGEQFRRRLNHSTGCSGINQQLRQELDIQHVAARQLTKFPLELSLEDKVLPVVRSYVRGKAPWPLVIHGTAGSGRTSVLVQAARSCSEWMPDANVVFRLARISPDSSSIDRLLSSLIQQISFLVGKCRSLTIKVSLSEPRLREAYDLSSLLNELCCSKPLIILLDGLDCLSWSSSSALTPSERFSSSANSSCPSSPSSFEWFPTQLPENIRVVVTATDSSSSSSRFFDYLRENVPSESQFVALSTTKLHNASKLLQERLLQKKRRLTPHQAELIDCCLKDSCCNPLHVSLVAQCSAFLSSYSTVEPHLVCDTLQSQLDKVLDLFDSKLRGEFGAPADLLQSTFGLLLLSKHGLSELELSDLLHSRYDTTTTEDTTFLLSIYPRYLYNVLSPSVLTKRTVRRTTLLCVVSNTMESLLATRFLSDSGRRAALLSSLQTYWQSRTAADNLHRKMEELPAVVGVTSDRFVFDWSWVFEKISRCSVGELLDDTSVVDDDDEVHLFGDVLRQSMAALSYDSRQFFSQMYARMSPGGASGYQHLEELLDTITRAVPVTCLLPLLPGFLSASSADCELLKSSLSFDSDEAFTMHHVKDCPSAVVVLCPSRNELLVWNAYEHKAIRRLVGVPQPRDIKFIDSFRALILCNRELCIYDLNEGKFLMKLKGVMNQKMAYYGLHDADHVVALSRNRMYVNMTNLRTGDCVATFKVGEDRFLNSLLVSSNGRVCVCGDETQKPFPLLVWDLDSRKLMYDLRLPHHDFITNLSAITSDGHYVVCVCQEVSDPSPNFIVVYDLQNGTLFKKWKPDISTCSVAISSEGGCVVSGLVNSNVLVWDLVTGACRFVLEGHTAPVTLVQLDKFGQRCLTADFPEFRDFAIRLWDVRKGISLASFMVDERPVGCILTEDGQAVVLGLNRQPNLVTLLLVSENDSLPDVIPASGSYGDDQFEGQSFDLNN